MRAGEASDLRQSDHGVTLSRHHRRPRSRSRNWSWSRRGTWGRCWCRRWCCNCGLWCRSRSYRWRGDELVAIDVIEHVFASDSSTRSGSDECVNVDAMIIDESTNDRREQLVRRGRRTGRCRSRSNYWSRLRCWSWLWRRRSHWCWRRLRWRSSGSRCGCWCRLWCRCCYGCSASGTDDGNDGADGNRVSFICSNLGQRSRNWRRDFGVDLVGGDFEQRLVCRDGVTDLLEPPCDRSFGHGLAELRKGDVSHGAPVGVRPILRNRVSRVVTDYALMLRPVRDITVSPNNSLSDGCGWRNSAISSTVASQFTAR